MRRRTTSGALVAVVAAIAILASGCVLKGTWASIPGFDPNPATRTSVYDLSCIDTTFCLAVGNENPPAAGQPIMPLVQRWDGTGWSAVGAPPTPAGATAIGLVDVSCASPTTCAVVTTPQFGSTQQPGFARWDGTGWSSVPLAGTLLAGENRVACAGDGSCLFVAADVGSTTWDGTSYTTTSYAAPALYDLSCTAIDACVGFDIDTDIAHVWDGSTWTAVSPPTPPGAIAPTWWSIDCASQNDCLIVGSARDSAQIPSAIGAHWDGVTWTATPLPAPSRELRAVSCTSSVACVATGYADQGAVTPTAFGWNGADWYAIDAPPSPGAFNNSWHILSCSTGDQCLAITNISVAGPAFAHYAWTA